MIKLTSECCSDLDVQLVCGHNFCTSSVRGRICHELKVVINPTMVVCLRGAINLDVLFVYSGDNCLIKRVPSRTRYNVMQCVETYD